jgi:transcriptional regulator with XRE-family HTH domain
MDNKQRDEIRDLLDRGMSSEEIAAKLGVSKTRVGAIKAHMTMGHYSGLLAPLARAAKKDPTRRADLEAELSRQVQIQMRGFDKLGEQAVMLSDSHPDITESATSPSWTGNAAPLGRAVHVRRVELGLKRRELAERARVSYPYLSQIENGAKQPSIIALARLASVLGLSLSELMYRGMDSPKQEVGTDTESVQSMHEGVGQIGDLPATPIGRRGLDERPLMAPAAIPDGNGNAIQDRQTQTIIAAVVRAELAAWARTELPAVVSEVVERVLRDRA